MKPHNSFAAPFASDRISCVSGFTVDAGGSIRRPTIRPITLAESIGFSGAEYIAQEKMDGVFAERSWQRSIIVGEQMRDGTFYAFDVATVQGDDCRRSPYWERLDALRSLAIGFDSTMKVVVQGNGQEFLEAVLARGGEGVVFKHREGYFGVGQYKAKRVETYDVRVISVLNQSVEIEFENQHAGKVAIMGRKIEAVKAGDMIEIAAHCRTASGKFREPRFIKLRPDKS